MAEDDGPWRAAAGTSHLQIGMTNTCRRQANQNLAFIRACEFQLFQRWFQAFIAKNGRPDFGHPVQLPLPSIADS
jgi:hypothetical protein